MCKQQFATYQDRPKTISMQVDRFEHLSNVQHIKSIRFSSVEESVNQSLVYTDNNATKNNIVAQSKHRYKKPFFIIVEKKKGFRSIEKVPTCAVQTSKKMSSFLQRLCQLDFLFDVVLQHQFDKVV